MCGCAKLAGREVAESNECTSTGLAGLVSGEPNMCGCVRMIGSVEAESKECDCGEIDKSVVGVTEKLCRGIVSAFP